VEPAVTSKTSIFELDASGTRLELGVIAREANKSNDF
jgi:hypothetical protein